MAVAAGLPLLLLQGAVLSLQADFDRMQRIAEERYGAEGSEAVAAWRDMIALIVDQDERQKLNTVNTFFNRRVRYMLDSANWNTNDYWATPLETLGRGAGDCEDYAIAKYMSLRLGGVANDKMRMIYVRARTGGATSGIDEAHMVLGYYASPTAEPLILDNIISDIRPASRRRDLSPVFSFNSEGLWAGTSTASAADPTARLSRWREVLERMQQEGLS